MKVIIEQDAQNSYLMHIDGITFTVMNQEGEDFTEEELRALYELVLKANEVSHERCEQGSGREGDGVGSA